MIQVEQLTKKYPGATAVDRLSFKVEKGEIVGFLGPNGAGKTTTMRLLTGFIRPTSGRAIVAGFDVETHPLDVRRSVGYMPENVPLYGEMRVSEFLQYRARLKGVSRKNLKARVDSAIGRCGLGDVRGRIIEQLSKGYRQRVGLAEALVHDPPILILDEPTVGLDPNQIRQVRGLITELGREHTLILSSHILPEVEQVCGRIVIIHRGSIVASDSPEALRDSLEGASNLQVILKRDGTAASGAGTATAGTGAGAPGGGPGSTELREALAGLPGVSSVEVDEAGSDGGLRARLSIDRGRDLREEVFRLVVARGWVLLELSQKAMTLEEIFVNLTTREPAGESAGEPGA